MGYSPVKQAWHRPDAGCWVASTEQEAGALCTACFTGDYPIPLPDESLLGKHLLEATLSSPTYAKALPVLNNP